MNANQTVSINLRDTGTKSLPGMIRWLLAALWVALLIILLRLPLDYRDIILMAAGILFFVWSLYDFTNMWLVFVLVLPFVYLVTGIFGEPKITGLRVFLVVFGVVFSLGRKPPGFWRALFHQGAFTGLILFFLANLVSAFVAGRSESVFRTIVYLEPLLFFLFSYYALRRRPAQLSRLVWMIVAGGVFVTALGLVEYAAQRPLAEVLGFQSILYDLTRLQFYLTEDRVGIGGRISSVLLQPVYAGFYFGVCLIAQVFYLLVYAPARRMWLVLLVPLGIGMVLASGSRGPIIGLVPAVLVFVAFSRRRSPTLVATILSLAVMVPVATLLFPNAVNYFFASLDPLNKESANFFGRITLTLNLLDFFKRSPIVGYGPGLIQKAAEQGVVGFQGLAGIENQYAMILADGGLVAGVTYLLFAGSTVAFLLKLYRSADRELHFFGLMLLTLFVYYSVVVVSVYALQAVAMAVMMSLLGAAAAVYDARVLDAVGSV